MSERNDRAEGAKPFSLEDGWRFRRVVTRDGRKAHVYGVTLSTSREPYPLLAHIDGDVGNRKFTLKGEYFGPNDPSKNDLFFAED